MSNPKAVLVSDVHYDLATLELADAALKMAIREARKLKVPLIIAGDLHNTKSNLRSECVNRLLKTIGRAGIAPYILIGNHDLENEKGEEHSLHFLEMHAYLVNEFQYLQHVNLYLIPYQSNLDKLKIILDGIPKGSTIIMHQGISGALPGEYSFDKTAAPAEWFSDYRVISGHYHTRQDIKTGRPQKGMVGMFSYIGNPYTINYGEAKDPEKGFQVLMDDGTLEFVPTNLRKHIKAEIDFKDLFTKEYTSQDENLVWIKVTVPREQAFQIKKELFPGIKNLRLEVVLSETTSEKVIAPSKNSFDLLDQIIDAQNIPDKQKGNIKELWRDLVK